uniref:ATP synthase subunit b, chloroplastic n=1 Tax=Nitellopsis obtusa TaxID=40811 RepID=A0A8F6U4S0_9VIRI|nr:ATP synthase CF0 I subunit [Nitellopsis obtusa]
MSEIINTINPMSKWPLASQFGFNLDIFDTNLINLGVVIGTLLYFGNEVITNLLSKRKDMILSSIKDAEERYQDAIEKLKQAKIDLEKAKFKANEIRIQASTQMEIEKNELIDAASRDSKHLEESKNLAIHLEEQRILEEMRREVSRLALQKTLIILNNRLTSQLQVEMIDYNIDLFFNTFQVPINLQYNQFN